MQNKKTYTDFIITELNKGNVKYNDVCLLFCTKFDLTKQTFNKFWKIANTMYSEQREAINKEILSTSIAVEKEAVKKALKTKFERLMILQKLVDECLEQLVTGKCNDTIIQGETIKNIKRLMNQRELNDTRKTLQSLQSEISKIEGDYAPNKLDISTENPIPIFNQNPLNE